MFSAELPKPELGEPSELKALRMQPAQEDVLTMSQTLDKLLVRDAVQVELIPEKKGLFLKHVEYQVTSQARARSYFEMISLDFLLLCNSNDVCCFCCFQRYKISVYRRYSDFDVFHEVLLQRFAYRVVPALPPKRMLKGGASLRLHRSIPLFFLRLSFFLNSLNAFRAYYGIFGFILSVFHIQEPLERCTSNAVGLKNT